MHGDIRSELCPQSPAAGAPGDLGRRSSAGEVPLPVILAFVLMCLTLAGVSELAGEEAAGEKSAPYAPKLLKQGDVIRQPVWGVEITIPEFEFWADHGMNAQPNFVLAANSNGPCILHLSMFAEWTRRPIPPEECRTSYAGDPSRVRKLSDARLISHETAPITFTRFDQTIEWEGEDVLQNQLYAYWTRSDHCFELHVSAIACADFDRQSMPILRSVRIGPETGATVETTRLALARGGDPRDWKHHYTAAMGFLFSADQRFWQFGGAKEAGVKLTVEVPPPDAVAARRHLEAALTLGGVSIAPAARVAIHLYLGQTYVLEEDTLGELRHSEAALELAREVDVHAELLERLILDVALTRVEADREEAACDLIREHFLGMEADERKRKAADVRREKDLKRLRKAACYKALVKELDLR
jgi:hypothetical protein